MRAEGADIVVALTHIPFYVEEDGAICGETVSYTHLDVYKRQLLPELYRTYILKDHELTEREK